MHGLGSGPSAARHLDGQYECRLRRTVRPLISEVCRRQMWRSSGWTAARNAPQRDGSILLKTKYRPAGFGSPQFFGYPIELPQSNTGGNSGKGHAILTIPERGLGLAATAALKQQSCDNWTIGERRQPPSQKQAVDSAPKGSVGGTGPCCRAEDCFARGPIASWLARQHENRLSNSLAGEEWLRPCLKEFRALLSAAVVPID